MKNEKKSNFNQWKVLHNTIDNKGHRHTHGMTYKLSERRN